MVAAKSVNVSNPESCPQGGQTAELCAMIGASVLECEMAIAKRRNSRGLSRSTEEKENLSAKIDGLRTEVRDGAVIMAEEFGLREPCPEATARRRECSLKMAKRIIGDKVS